MSIEELLNRSSGIEQQTREQKLQLIYSLFQELTNEELDKLIMIIKTI